MATRTPSESQNGALDPALPQKKRARRRLVGAGALALIAAIVLPMILDSEPRQVREEVQVRIPARDTPISERADGGDKAGSPTSGTASGASPSGAGSGSTPAAAGGAASGTSIAPAPGVGNAPGVPEASVATAPPDSATEAKPADTSTPGPRPADSGSTSGAEPKSSAKTEPKPETKVTAKADTKPKGESRAEAKVEAKAEPKTDSKGSFHLQVGAFASEKAALEQQERIRKVGVKAFTERVTTPQGDRIRVRVGPYQNREAADQVRNKLRAAGIDVTVVAY